MKWPDDSWVTRKAGWATIWGFPLAVIGIVVPTAIAVIQNQPDRPRDEPPKVAQQAPEEKTGKASESPAVPAPSKSPDGQLSALPNIAESTKEKPARPPLSQPSEDAKLVETATAVRVEVPGGVVSPKPLNDEPSVSKILPKPAPVEQPAFMMRVPAPDPWSEPTAAEIRLAEFEAERFQVQCRICKTWHSVPKGWSAQHPTFPCLICNFHMQAKTASQKNAAKLRELRAAADQRRY